MGLHDAVSETEPYGEMIRALTQHITTVLKPTVCLLGIGVDSLEPNPSHISKLFAAYDEHNVNTVLKTLRLEHAVELLNETNLSIDEITEQCGFSNTSYFIKIFRLFYGSSPGVFRQSKHSN